MRPTDSGVVAAVQVVYEDESTVEHGDDTAISIGNRSATLDTARLAAGAVVTVPDGPFGHVYVVKGCVDFEAHGTLNRGHGVRPTAERLVVKSARSTPTAFTLELGRVRWTGPALVCLAIFS